MKKKPFLDLYNKCCELGTLPHGFGLCYELDHLNCFYEIDLMRDLFAPKDDKEARRLNIQPFYWGSGSPLSQLR